MAQYARRQRIRQFLVACVPAHARFYRRFLGFELIGRPRPFPMDCHTLGKTCRFDFEQIERCRPNCYDTYFGDPVRTAQLVHVPMTAAERGFYGRVIVDSERRV